MGASSLGSRLQIRDCILAFFVKTVLGTIGWVYFLLPYGLQCLWGRTLGFLIYQAKLRRKVVKENLLRAFPGEGAEVVLKRKQLERRTYTHIGQTVLEIFMLFSPIQKLVAMKFFANRYTEMLGVENWKAAISKGKGAIYLANHVGNWEVMAAAGRPAGLDILMVTKHLKPEWLHRAIESGRKECGIDATYEPYTMKAILRRLRQGKSVGIVLDQYAGAPIGVRVPFFGIPVGTSTGLAAIVKRTGAAVLPCRTHRRADGVTQTDVRPEVPWISRENPDEELAVNTARYAEIIEEDIRTYPEEWLWTHRRFKGDLSPLREKEWTQRRARR